MNAFAFAGFLLVVVTAIGFWIRIVWSGTT